MIAVEDYRTPDLDPMIRMWRESLEYGVGVADPPGMPEGEDPVAGHRAYFESEVLPKHRVRLAKDAGLMVGLLASNSDSVAALYIRVGHHRRGIGRQLLELAKADSSGTLWLYTFARNTVACAFYESQGFKVLERGFEPTWQLDDVKYAWARAEGAV